MSRQKLATLFLMVGMFLNPMGFDAIQLTLIKLTGSLLRANFVLYCLAVFFFGLYFYFSGNNPITTIKNIIVNIYNNKFKKIKEVSVIKKISKSAIRKVL